MRCNYHAPIKGPPSKNDRPTIRSDAIQLSLTKRDPMTWLTSPHDHLSGWWHTPDHYVSISASSSLCQIAPVQNLSRSSLQVLGSVYLLFEYFSANDLQLVIHRSFCRPDSADPSCPRPFFVFPLSQMLVFLSRCVLFHMLA